MSVIIDLLNLLKIHIDGPQGHVLEGDALVNVLVGTGGDDYVEGKGLADTLSGGAGIDTLGYVSSPAGVNVDLAPGFLGLFITQASGGDANGDIVTASFENLIGSAFDDTLKGTSGANTIAGLAGNDSIYGRDGDDILIGGAGADYLNGGNGFDIADYSSSNGIGLTANASGVWTGTGGDAQGDTLVSIERVTGTAGNDTIDASLLTTAVFIDNGDGNDVVKGGSGNDSFIYGPGFNDISGGAGDDTFFFNDHTFVHGSLDPENPTNLGVINGGDGETVLDFSSLSTGIHLTMSDSSLLLQKGIDDGPIASSAFARSGGVQDSLTVEMAYNANGLSETVLTGSNDTVDGSSGDDYLFGGGGNDTMNGGGGNDILYGNVGDDILQGGDGRDLLTGGSGNDRFVYAAVSDSPASRDEATLDHIYDFEQRKDVIDLSAFAGTVTFVTGSFADDGTSQVRVVAATLGVDRMELDSDGNGAADMAVLVNHQENWSAFDFVLL